MTKNPRTTFNDALFFAKLNHELRAPIHGITGLSNYLHDNWEKLSEDIKKSCINDITKAGSLLKDLVETLYQLSNANANSITWRLEKTDIVKIAKQAIENNRLFIIDRSLVNISLKCEEEEVFIMIDQFWITQLLFNLINNAVKHSGGQNITVSIRSQSHKSSTEKITVVSIIDDGIGIPPNQLKSIFDPFKQVSNNKKSTQNLGLGLTICKEVATAHGGEIWAENNDTGGTTISFTLPTK